MRQRICKSFGDYERWDVRFCESDLVAHLGTVTGPVVYLSADAEETLETIEEDATYIIGGIVDRNRHKVLLWKRAPS